MPEKASSTKTKLSPAEPSSTIRKRATAKPAASAKPVKKDKKDKKVNGKVEIKEKVIRDSFTMPQNDYARIGELKQVCQKVGMQVKKSELLRAGLHALGKLSVTQLKQTISQIEQIKTGRPKKS